MLVYPDIDPVAFRAFGFPVRWYGLMYLFALGLAVAYGRRVLARKAMFADSGIGQILDFVTAAALGVIVGGRLGYALFYKWADYAQEPLSVFYLWQGGMSFHGGLIGAIMAIAIYARRVRAPFLRHTDLAALLAAPGLGLGRLGNFIGGELPGRVASSDLPWAMIYRHIDELPRHPSQLYQAFLEGVVLTAIMIFLARKWRPAGWLSAMFLIYYGVLRFISEFFREPDSHLGLQLFDLSRGQWLSFPMIFAGAVLLLWLAKHKRRKNKPKRKPVIAGLLAKLLAVFPRRLRFAKKKSANRSADVVVVRESAAAEVAVAKPSAVLAFAIAVGGYIVALPLRFFAYMRHSPQIEEAEEEYAEEVKDEPEKDGNQKGALWRFFFDETAEAEGEYAEEIKEEQQKDKNEDGALWRFFFDDNEPPARVEEEDDESEDWQPQAQPQGRKDRRERFDDGGFEDMESEDDDWQSEDDNQSGNKRRGGLFGFFFADDEEDDEGRAKPERQSRRDKRRMKKKKRR